MRNAYIITSVLIIIANIILGYFWNPGYYFLFLTLPVIGIGFYDILQKKHTILRNFPLFGHGRYIMEEARPKIYQYFVESDTDGTPFSRMLRSIVYQRAKKVLDTHPFGTQLDVYSEGYEWINHSLSASDHHKLEQNPRVKFGSSQCSQPYEASILNISAMSYGALSRNAIKALNGGAKKGKFAHNTGEGGLSPHHLEPGGDIIWQVGTGYFGCRTKDGDFDPDLFKEKANAPQVKMIEIKLSQGAKPGHGGILPAVKISDEIAEIRNVPKGQDVISPPYHRAFDSPIGLMKFIEKLRELSNGKPVGFKFCVGRKSEFIAICKAINETGIYPDFITVDGSEGGTGAAPLEFSNSMGMPLREAIAFVHNVLCGYGLRDEIRIISSGKIITGFHIARAIALGADACNSARGMMMALGCIQALECNKNTCPTGVATTDPEKEKGLVVSDKTIRVANFHQETVEAFVELLAACGLKHPGDLNRSHIYRRISMSQINRFDELYPYIKKGAFLYEETTPNRYKIHINESDPSTFNQAHLTHEPAD